MEEIRVAIYARVSTVEQAEEGYSIDSQLLTVRKKVEADGKVVVKEYVDRGISGKSMTNRFALQQMLVDAKKKMFDEVWVWKTNRLARNQLDLLKIVNELEMNNVGFKSCSESFDTTTPSGKLLLHVLASIGEFERETIAENVKMGMKQRARLGKWNGGQILGYTSVKDESGTKTKLVIVEKEAEVIRKIFNLYAKGKGLKAITNQINKEGYRTKRGNLFSTTAVKEILMNPAYIGKIRFNLREDWARKRRKGINKDPILVDGEHEPIIEEKLWKKVQELYNKKACKPNRIFDSEYILTGLMKCPECGASMVAGRTKNKLKDGTYRITRYYVCGAWRNKGSSACHANSVRADYAEEYVINRLQEIVKKEKVLKDIVKKLNNERKESIKPLEKELEGVNKKITELVKRKNKIFEAFEEGLIDKDDFKKRLNVIQNDMDKLIDRKHELEIELSNNNSVNIPYELVKSVLENFNKLMKQASPQQKKILLHAMINKIIVTDRKRIDGIEIHYDESVKKILFDEGELPPDGGGGSPIYFTLIA